MGFRAMMEQARVKRGRKAAENAAPSSVQVLDRSPALLALIAENDGSRRGRPCRGRRHGAFNRAAFCRRWQIMVWFPTI